MDIILQCIRPVTIKDSDFFIFNKLRRDFKAGEIVLTMLTSAGFMFRIDGKWTASYSVHFVKQHFIVWRQSMPEVTKAFDDIKSLLTEETTS